MFKFQSTSLCMRRAVAVAAVFSAGFVAASAQTTVSSATTLNLQAPLVQSAPVFSSSSDENAPVVAENHFNFVDFNSVAQPARRGYGRPRYRGANTNPDGSSKYAFVAGAGFTQPIGNTYHYLTPSYGITVGGGRQFNKNFALLLQFDYDHFGFNGRTLGNQLNLYNYEIGLYNAGQSAANQITPLTSLDGSSHIWSFTLNPTYTIYSGEGLGAYVVGGVGFYHKVANFTTPGVGTYCDPFYGCYQYVANQEFDHYFSNAPGFNGGFGLTYKFSKFSNERLYGEVRYVFIDNQQRQGLTVFNATAANSNTNNDYPANSNRTTYIPVKFGLRF